MIAGNSANDTLQQLVARGFDRDCFHLCLGGRLNVDAAFQDWVRERLSIEECLGDAFVSPSNNLKPPPLPQPMGAMVPVAGYSLVIRLHS